MKITFEKSGGFAGRILRKELDTESLAPADKVWVETQLQACRFFDLPSLVPPPRPASDLFQYLLKVEREGKSHQVTFREDSRPPGLKPLLDWMEKQQDRT